MQEAWAVLRFARDRRTLAVVAGLAFFAAGQLVSGAVKRWQHVREEVVWLRARLLDKGELIARQRLEMNEVAAAADRVIRAMTTTKERAADARRLAHMEETRAAAPDVIRATTTSDLSGALLSEDAARTLEELSWLEGETAAVGDSLTVLSALLKERPTAPSRGGPSLWPVRGTVTSRFGPRPSPYGDGNEVHPGIDIQAQYGMPVTAGGDGEVILAGRDPGYGRLVIIDHGGDVDTLYGHLSAVYVREGQKVRRGQPLGAVGASGRATGAHLHYEVRVRNTPVDPRRYLVN
jgi:murein DD-endopeptidase MepM/ murein hydrolase activator NlpD